MQIFLIGPSGSGKDTQAKLISQEFDLHWLSVGEYFRQIAKVNDDMGQYIQHAINTGNLLDWVHLEPVILSELKVNSHNFIWTGFPRLLSQAKRFDNLINQFNSKLDLVINLSLDDNKSKERIEYRKNSDPNVRQDDLQQEAIERRLSWYKESIEDIREYYLQRFIEVDATKSVQSVFQYIKQEINKKAIDYE